MLQHAHGLTDSALEAIAGLERRVVAADGGRLKLEGERSAIYGFVVSARQRGKGIGREVLRHVCQEQFDHGAERVDLEVEVQNDRALALYTSVGFEPVITEDYYELVL